MGLVASGFEWIGNWKKAKAEKLAAEAAERKRLNMAQSLDWDPEYASNNVPTYQRSQAPIADSYINSFLLGNNPAATFSGSPNAGFEKGRQQAAQNGMFGTPQQRLSMDRRLASEQPWAVKAPTRSVESTPRNAPPSQAPEGFDQKTWDNMSAQERSRVISGKYSQSSPWGAVKEQNPDDYEEKVMTKYGRKR